MTHVTLAEKRLALKVLFWFSAAVAAIFFYWTIYLILISATQHDVTVSCRSLVITIIGTGAALYFWTEFRAIHLVLAPAEAPTMVVIPVPAPARPLKVVGVSLQVSTEGQIKVVERWTPDPEIIPPIDPSWLN